MEATTLYIKSILKRIEKNEIKIRLIHHHWSDKKTLPEIHIQYEKINR